jgi:hypothetical protein
VVLPQRLLAPEGTDEHQSRDCVVYTLGLMDQLPLDRMPTNHVDAAEHDAAEQVRLLEAVVLAKLREACNPRPEPPVICPALPVHYAEQLLAFG